MNGSDLGNAFAEGIKSLIIVAFVAGITLALFFAVALPKIWEWIKPLVHQWTA